MRDRCQYYRYWDDQMTEGEMVGLLACMEDMKN